MTMTNVTKAPPERPARLGAGALHPQAWGLLMPTLAGALTGGVWIGLAFVPHQRRGLLLAAVLLASSGLALGFTGVAASARWWTRDASAVAMLRRQLARCSLATLVLAGFFPEYLARLQPALLRSVLLLAIVAVLWATLCICTVRAEQGRALPEPAMHRGAFAALCLLFLMTTAVAIRKYEVFGYVGQDLAYFGQILHTTLHGHLFWGNLLQDLIYSRPVTTDFAGHNSPIMFLLLPFYAVFRSPVTLLVVRNLVLFGCALPVFLLARRSVSSSAAWLWVGAFLLTPAILSQSTFDFYPLSLVALPLLFALHFYLEERYLAFVVALAATLLVREDLVFFAFGLGLLALLHRRSPKWSLVSLAAAIVWGIVSFKVVLPFALHGATFVTDACFAHLGHGPAEMARNLALHPGRNILVRDNVVYVKTLLTAPGLVLPWGSPVSLLSLPYIAINLLAGAGPCITTVIAAQYSVIPATLLFAGTLLTVTGRPWGRRFLASVAHLGLPNESVAPLLLIALSCGSLVFVTGRPEFDSVREQTWGPEARHVLTLIPPEASVAAPRYLLPHLANRDCLYQTHRLPQYHDAHYEYLIVDTSWSHINAAATYRNQYEQVARSAAKDPALETVYSSPQYRVYRDARQHGATCDPGAVAVLAPSQR